MRSLYFGDLFAIRVCFCAGTLTGLGLSWINKYDTKMASRSLKRFVQNS